MSAFIVSDNHISAMIAYLFRFDHYDRPLSLHVEQNELEAERLAKLLLDENYKSVNYRYQEQEATPVIKLNKDYFRLDKPFPFTAIEIIKAARCYDYQACEHKEYETSEAKRLTEHLISLAIGNLPGYEEAPWGIRPDFQSLSA